MSRARSYHDNAARQRAYRERKRNGNQGNNGHNDVTFDELFRAIPVAPLTGTNEYYTPRWLITAAHKVLGGIDLDPATNAEAQAIIQARRHYTVVDNGLIQPWAGRVWCNPPYSDPLPWVQKLIGHYRDGDVSAGVLLLNVAGTPEWAQMLWNGGYSVCIVSKRIAFWRTDDHAREHKRTNMYDQFIWYLGRHRRRFADVFGQYGAIR